MSKKPRRLLVGGMKAKKILLATHLLRWYINHGLEITDIHSVVEYKPQKCFQKFTDYVTKTRRAADQGCATEIGSETAKLQGNSA